MQAPRDESLGALLVLKVLFFLKITILYPFTKFVLLCIIIVSCEIDNWRLTT